MIVLIKLFDYFLSIYNIDATWQCIPLTTGSNLLSLQGVDGIIADV